MKLYEILPAYNQLLQLADDPNSDDQEICKMLEECEGILQEKATNIAFLVRNMEADAHAMKEAESGIAARRKMIEARACSLRRYVLSSMVAADVRKISCPYFVLSVQKNPPSVIVDDESSVPIQYLRQSEPPPPSIDKKAIIEDIKQGVVIEGVHIEQAERLVIK